MLQSNGIWNDRATVCFVAAADAACLRKMNAMVHDDPNDCLVALVFSGGLGLASYHAGAYDAFAAQKQPLHWVTGSSAGAVTAALIAGNQPQDRVARLRTFWNLSDQPHAAAHPWRHMQSWISVIETHLVGAAGQFTPRIPSANPLTFRSLYDLEPMKARLAKLVDFGLLNSGEIRISIAATDVATGDPVFFDSRTAPIEMDHILASCGLLPAFAPVAIGNQVLVDGGLSLNAPFDQIIAVPTKLRMFVLDLFARDGRLPRSMESAAERKTDLIFGNQTYLRLRDKIEIRRLRGALASGQTPLGDEIFLLSYRTDPAEPGPEKPFNFSPATVIDRWNAGYLDMEHALSGSGVEAHGITAVRRPAMAVAACGTPAPMRH